MSSNSWRRPSRAKTIPRTLILPPRASNRAGSRGLSIRGKFWPRNRGKDHLIRWKVLSCTSTSGTGRRRRIEGSLPQKTAALPPPELGVKPARGQQFAMRPVLDDAAVIHDDEPVHLGDGRQAVGDGDGG